jgi:hypothetical protein
MAGGNKKIEAADGKPFVKGDPRINKAGRPRKLPDLDSLLIEVLGEHVRGKEALKGILIALRKKANAGDVRAAELLMDRAYGKIKQQTEHSGTIAVPITGINYIVPDGNNNQPNK